MKKVQEFIERKDLLSKGGLHLVALSGGADSVALVRILHSLGYKTEAIHCNFHLRGEESNRDEAFCKALCQQLNIPLHLVHFDTKTYSELHHVSIEMAARDLRYNHFRQLKETLNAESICVAHHKDDCAETVLMNLVRGTGLKGLTGIRAKNGDIVRPLLCLSRQEIEAYLSSISQDYVTDSTNLTDEATRNKYRLHIFPLLKEINPSVIESITSTAQHLEEMLPIVEVALEDCRKKCVSLIHSNSGEEIVKIDIEELEKHPSPQFLLFNILSENGIPNIIASQIAENRTTQSGKFWEGDGKLIVKDRNALLISSTPKTPTQLVIPEEGIYVHDQGKRLSVKRFTKHEDFEISKSTETVHLDADSISFPLCLRTTKPGDRFIPLGMKGSKLISDFLTDRKLSVIEKRQQLCLTDSNGRIIWVVNLRINEKNKTTEKTKNILEIEYK